MGDSEQIVFIGRWSLHPSSVLSPFFPNFFHVFLSFLVLPIYLVLVSQVFFLPFLFLSPSTTIILLFSFPQECIIIHPLISIFSRLHTSSPFSIILFPSSFPLSPTFTLSPVPFPRLRRFAGPPAFFIASTRQPVISPPCRSRVFLFPSCLTPCHQCVRTCSRGEGGGAAKKSVSFNHAGTQVN